MSKITPQPKYKYGKVKQIDLHLKNDSEAEQIKGKLATYTNIARNKSSGLEFAKAALEEAKESGEQKNILFSVLIDLKALHGKGIIQENPEEHPIYKALATYMGKSLSPEELADIRKAALENQTESAISTAPSIAVKKEDIPENPKTLIMSEGLKEKGNLTSQKTENLKRSFTQMPEVAILEGNSDPEVIKAANAKNRIKLKPKSIEKHLKKHFSFAETSIAQVQGTLHAKPKSKGEYPTHRGVEVHNAGPVTKIENLDYEILTTKKSALAAAQIIPNAIQPMNPEQAVQSDKNIQLAQDSVSTPQASSAISQTRVSAEDIDAITKMVREEILLNQQKLIKAQIISNIEKQPQPLSSQNASKLKNLKALNLTTKEDLAKFHTYLNRNKDEITTVFNDPAIQKQLNKLEVAGYEKVHKTFNQSFSTVPWSKSQQRQDGVSIRSTTVGNGITIHEETHQKQLPIKDSNGQDITIKYRTINFRQNLGDKKGPLHMDMALRDQNGNNMPADKALYFTAHYDKEGKLTEVSSPVPVKFMGNDPKAVGYIERDGKIYTLPVTQEKYQQMMKEVKHNQGVAVNISQEQAPQQARQNMAVSSPQMSALEQSPRSPEQRQDNQEQAPQGAPRSAAAPSSPAQAITITTSQDAIQALKGATTEQAVTLLTNAIAQGNTSGIIHIANTLKEGEDGIPKLKQDDYRNAYIKGISEAKYKHGRLYHEIDKACAPVRALAGIKENTPQAGVPIGKLAPPSARQDREHSAPKISPEALASQQQALSMANRNVKPKPIETPLLNNPNEIIKALKNKKTEEVIELLGKEIKKGNHETVGHIIEATKKGKDGIPKLTREQYTKLYHDNMKKAPTQNKDITTLTRTHRACGKLTQVAEISTNYHLQKIQQNLITFKTQGQAHSH